MIDDEEKPITEKQRKALHLYFDILADILNDAGLDMRKVLKPEVSIPWAGASVKEYMWRPIQKTMLQKQSTTELTTKEVDKVFNTVNLHLAKFGVHQPFPSMEAIFQAMLEKEDLTFTRRYMNKR